MIRVTIVSKIVGYEQNNGCSDVMVTSTQVTVVFMLGKFLHVL